MSLTFVVGHWNTHHIRRNLIIVHIFETLTQPCHASMFSNAINGDPYHTIHMYVNCTTTTPSKLPILLIEEKGQREPNLDLWRCTVILIVCLELKSRPGCLLLGGSDSVRSAFGFPSAFASPHRNRTHSFASGRRQPSQKVRERKPAITHHYLIPIPDCLSTHCFC